MLVLLPWFCTQPFGLFLEGGAFTAQLFFDTPVILFSFLVLIDTAVMYKAFLSCA